MGNSKILITSRKGKRRVILCVSFIFLSLFYPFSVFAATWGDVLTAYNSAKVMYPGDTIWIEFNSQGDWSSSGRYRLWRRVGGNTTKFRDETYSEGVTVTADVNSSSNGWYNCDGTYRTDYNRVANVTVDIHKRREKVYSIKCSGSKTLTSDTAITGSAFYLAYTPCFKSAVEYGLCTTKDTLLQEFVLTSDCSVVSSVSSSGEWGYSNSNGCGCTPNGSVYSRSDADKCYYTPIVGDPVSPSTLPTGDLPGFNVLTSSVTSPPVTNSDGSITTTTTNVYPDNNTQDVVTSTERVNSNGTTTIERVVERWYGGVSLGFQNTSTQTINPDGSSVIQSVNTTDGITSTILTGGGISSTTTAYTSGLTLTTITDSSGASSTTTNQGGGGTGVTGGSGSIGSVWDDPPSGTIITNPSVDSSTYDTTLEMPEEKSWIQLITGWMSANPFLSVIQGTKIETSGDVCKIDFELWGRPMSFDFCGFTGLLAILGYVVFSIAALRAVFISFGVDT